MKRLVILAGCAFALTACADASVAPLEPDAISPAFSATTGTNSASFPFSLVAFVPCANGGLGEAVLLDGRLHFLIHNTIDARGGVHSKVHFQPQDLSGEGMTTGDRYNGTGVTQQTTIGGSGGTQVVTFVNNFRMIGRGRAPSYHVHQTVHATVNANGELTAQVDDTSITCR